jgi:uncharacterized delta-60 repeat protein
MSPRTRVALLAALLACGAPEPGETASGDLDAGLLGGRAHTDFDGWFDQAENVLVQPDGKIVAGGLARRKTGQTPGGTPLFRAELALVRYTATGALDDTFGDHGRVRTDFGEDVDVRTLARDPSNGDLIAVGNTPLFPQKLVFARYHADGTPDAAVGGGTGRVITDVPGFAFASYVDGGKVVVGGQATTLDDFLIARFGADGTPDPTFDGDGFVVSSLGGAVRGLVPAAGGRIVAAGWVQGGSLGGFRNFAVARFLETGAPDLVFGPSGTGETSIDFFNAAGGDEARAIARMGNGALAVGGFAFEGSGQAADRHFALAMLTEDGMPVGSFGGTGKVTTPLPEAAIVRQVFPQTSGKIVVVGETGLGIDTAQLGSTRPNIALARYETNGTLDPTFGDDGTIVHRLRGAEMPRAATIQADDKPIVAGRFREDWLVLRLTPTGQADSTFGRGGRVLIDDPSMITSFGGALQSDGKMLVAGRGFCPSDCTFLFQNHMAVTRHLSDGRLDPTFGDLGFALPRFAGNQVANAVAEQADHAIVAAGAAAETLFSDDDFALVRLTAAGAPDVGFGSMGLATVDFFGGHDRVRALAVQPADQKLVVGGSVETGGKTVFGLVRFLPGGTLDPNFGVGGKVTTDLPGQDDQVLALLVQADAKIVAVGETSGSTSGTIALVRYLGDGTPDPGFGTNGVVTTPVTTHLDGGGAVLRQGA